MATSVSVGRATRRWLPLSLVCLAIGLATAMASPFLALFLDDAVGADPLRVTLFLAAAPISAVVAASLVGRFSDRLPSRRPLLVATAVAGCAGLLVTAFVRDYATLLLVTVTLTALAGATMPQTFAYAREAIGDGTRAAMGMSALRTLFSVSWVAGPPLAAVLLGVGGFEAVYAFAAAMYAVSAVLALALPASGAPVPEADAVAPRAPGADAPRLLLWTSVTVFVLTRCAGALTVQGLSLYVTHELGGDVHDAGLLLGLCAGLEVPLMLGFGWLATRFGVHRLLMLGTAAALAYAILAALSGSLWPLVAGQVLNAASIAALHGLGLTYVQDMLPGRPGRASTLFSNAFPMGALLAAPVLGLAQEAGYRMPFVVAAVLCGVALVLLATARGKSRQS